MVWDMRAEVVVGYLVLCLGLIMGFYYYAGFDTSVPTTPVRAFADDRVVNTGLANDRLVGALAALGLIITGGTLVISGRVKAATRHLAYVRAK
jgi:transketolase C-terminal domain/subunit